MGILGDPLGRGSLPLCFIALPLLGNGDLLSVLSIWCLHERQDGLNDKLGVQGGHPVLIDGLRANLASVRLYTWMVDLGHELDLGWLEGIVVREVKVHCEATSDERSALGAVDVHIPDHHVVFSGLNRGTWDGSFRQITKFLVTVATKRECVRNL